MLAELFIGAVVLNALGKIGDNRVTHGRDIFGNRYKKVSGRCYTCGGSGSVHGHTCRKCGGSGTFSSRTWYS